MKKWLCLTLALLMIFSLFTACGDEDTGVGGNGSVEKTLVGKWYGPGNTPIMDIGEDGTGKVETGKKTMDATFAAADKKLTVTTDKVFLTGNYVVTDQTLTVTNDKGELIFTKTPAQTKKEVVGTHYFRKDDTTYGMELKDDCSGTIWILDGPAKQEKSKPTSSAPANVNKVQADELDVALMMNDSTGWVDAEGETLSFTNVENSDNILWEPGATYDLPQLKIVNNGNLAFKYTVLFNGISGNTELADVFDVFVNDEKIGTLADVIAKTDGFKTGVMNTKGEETAFAIKMQMQATAGNTYQNKTINGLSVTVIATPTTDEKHSNDNQEKTPITYTITKKPGTTSKPGSSDDTSTTDSIIVITMGGPGIPHPPGEEPPVNNGQLLTGGGFRFPPNNNGGTTITTYNEKSLVGSWKADPQSGSFNIFGSSGSLDYTTTFHFAAGGTGSVEIDNPLITALISKINMSWSTKESTLTVTITASMMGQTDSDTNTVGYYINGDTLYFTNEGETIALTKV